MEGRYRITARYLGFIDFDKRYTGSLESVLGRFGMLCISRFNDDVHLDEIDAENRVVRRVAWKPSCRGTVRRGDPDAPKAVFFTADARRLAEGKF